MEDGVAKTNSNLNVLLNQLACARNEIKNLRQQLVSLKHSHRKDVQEVQEFLKAWTCSKCVNRGSPAPASSGNAELPSGSGSALATPGDPPCRLIGYVETDFASKRGVPRQPGLLAQSQGIVRLDRGVLNNPQHALEGLEHFSHMWILFYFHANESNHVKAKVSPPRLNGIRTGVFATRSPHRPSPIGLSLVKIDSIQDDSVVFSGVDMVDGTPVLDLKPYIPQYDSPFPTVPSTVAGSTTRWERLPRESDGRSEDGDSILQDQSDNDYDFQDRLLVGEASQSSADRLDGSGAREEFPSQRVLDGRDSDEVFLSTARGIPAHDSVNSEYFDRSPMRSASQREAPEGSEGGSPPSPLPPIGNVRVADWIANPPVSRLVMQFANDCSRKIERIMGSASLSVQVHNTIVSILSADPRSVYVRERYADEPYTCVIEMLNVTCFFDDTAHVCLVTDVECVSSGDITNLTP